MKIVRNALPGRNAKAIVVLTASLALSFVAGNSVSAVDKVRETQEQHDQSTITTGSGKRYQTTVSRQTEGELTAQDLHQVSLLASRTVNHLNEAVKGLVDQDTSTAESELKKAQRLTAVIRELLPVTTVTTVVKDAAGAEVYRDVDQVQDDRIALYQGMIALEVVEPIVDAKKEEAALKGVRLADADVIHTSVLADLSYIERKLNRAAALLDEPDEALTQLVLAQTQGVQLSVNAADDPLVKVQQALRLAERMVEEGNHEAARENLRIAQYQLGTYRSLLGTEKAKVVQDLEEEISALMPRTEDTGTADKIRAFWERAVSWFQQESGQATVVEETNGDGDAQRASRDGAGPAPAGN